MAEPRPIKARAQSNQLCTIFPRALAVPSMCSVLLSVNPPEKATVSPSSLMELQPHFLHTTSRRGGRGVGGPKCSHSLSQERREYAPYGDGEEEVGEREWNLLSVGGNLYHPMKSAE